MSVRERWAVTVDIPGGGGITRAGDQGHRRERSVGEESLT